MKTRRRLPQIAARIRRGLIVGVALIGYLAGAVGFPVPAASVKDRSRPFPCQDHACGCQNADQCWQHCCCYSAEEKRAWARAHQVEPPAAATPAAEKGWNSPRLRDQEAKPAPCSEAACCSCCSAPKPAAKAGAPKKRVAWVVGLAARHCGGEGNHWLTGEPSFAPPALVSWNFEWAPGSWLSAAEPSLVTYLSTPLAPPPRS